MRLLLTSLFAFVVAAAIYGSFEEIGFDPAFPRHDNLGDFGSFYESGRAALQGTNPYDIYPLTYFAAAGPGGAAINLNAPLSVVLFEILPTWTPYVAARIFNIAAVVAYLAAIGLLLASFPGARQPWRLIWALGVSSFWGTLALGQIYTFLALATALAWVLLRKDRSTLAGIVIGFIAAIKPNFLLWPVMLVFAGNRRVALTAGTAWFVFCLIPLVQMGPQVYIEWAQAALATGQNGTATNGALTGLAARLGIGSIGLLLNAALTVAVGVWMFLRKPSAIQSSAVALITTLLASPLAWTGYATLLLPVFFSRHRWSIAMMCAAGLLLIPVGSVLLPLSETSNLAMVIVGSAYTWAWLLLLASSTTSATKCTAETP
ncbi:MAG: DUF2029 domain-containing protein [Chloroflexi bacterium]|nr:DUF2029 domain-containing protein [Chloroflexota bacterium]MBV9131261.1 DUF2029 domain-containing protein [Chloroflexota bacterium]MBV9895922.1 DUF2029 domain-containing protein [Chloroflexota bacterium]